MRKLIFTISLVAVASTVSNAQVRLGLYGLADFPQVDFHNSGYYNGGGFGISIMSGVLNSTSTNPNPFVKLHIGGNMDFNSFGSKEFNVDLTDARKATVDVSNNSFGLNLAARLIFTNLPVRPYLEGFAGLRTYGTDETISPLVKANGYEDETQRSVIARGTFAYGLSAGLLWKVKDWMDIETGVIYSSGSYSQYNLMDRVQQVGNEIQYGNYSGSMTNMFQIKLGVVFIVENCHCGSNSSNTYEETHTNYSIPSPGGHPNVIRPNARPGF